LEEKTGTQMAADRSLASNTHTTYSKSSKPKWEDVSNHYCLDGKMLE